MVDIEAISDDDDKMQAEEEEKVELYDHQEQPPVAVASEERFLDADVIEEAAGKMSRPSARAHLETLAKKLRREAVALKRVEESHKITVKEGTRAASATPANTPSSTPSATRAVNPPAAVTSPPPPPVRTTASSSTLSSAKYIPIDRFTFDAGSYNSPLVTLYIPLPSIGDTSVIPRDNITCSFTKTSFDLVVKDLKGKDYRLFKDNLEKDIDADKCKYMVKSDKIVIKLAKIKGEYGSYDSWTSLSAKKKKDPSKKEDPSASIMNLMKDMYDSGDDNMKKMIGETMLKQREGKLDPKMGSGGLGGSGLDDDF